MSQPQGALSSQSASFQRDQVTWMLYLLGMYYAYMQTGLGPIMAFLRDEFALSYSVAGMHFSAFAIGMIIIGVYGALFTSWLGRNRALWGGAGGMACGAILLIIAPHPAFTLSSTFLMGVAGSLMIMNTRAGISDHHAEFRHIATTESAILLSLGNGFSALAISVFVSVGLGWRFAPILILLIVLGLWLSQPPLQIKPFAAPTEQHVPSTLPRLFWVYWMVMFLGAGVEWSLNFWGTEFLTTVHGIEPATAAALMSGYFTCMVFGRYLGSRLVRSFELQRLLATILLIALLTFPIYWLVDSPIISIIAFYMIGIMIANLTPLVLSITLNIAPSAANAIASRISLAAGFAILLAPQLLGTVADIGGFEFAYGIVLVLLLVVTTLAWGGLRVSHQMASDNHA